MFYFELLKKVEIQQYIIWKLELVHFAIWDFVGLFESYYYIFTTQYLNIFYVSIRFILIIRKASFL